MALNKDPSCLGNSKDIAIRRLNSLWKRLSRDSRYLSLYAEFLKEYEGLGHLERVVDSSEPPTHYYIPHHGVLRPEKLTTKLRIVFNGSSPTTTGISLNDILLKGEVKEYVFESEVLSVIYIAKLYDPLGFLGPVIAKAKVFLQELWQCKLDWDDVLPNSIANEWREFVTTLKCIEEVKINRFIMADNNVRIVLQGFADASEVAYGAVVYLQCFLHNGAAKVSILASKSRVAPIRVISIPRLELCACVLLAQLVKKIRSTLRLSISNIVLHTDLSIALSWLNTPANRLKTFVANRVSKVQKLTEGFQWNHVPSVLNPADLVSRVLHPCDLPNLRLWWHGPQFFEKGKLSSEETSLPSVKECEYSKELKTGSSSDIITSSVCVSTNCVSSISSTLLRKSNSYMKIVRIFSYVLRFSNNVNKRKLTLSGPLSATDIDQAETKLIRMVQEQKAFDRVWLTGLTFKLITYNIPPPLICLLHSYNSDRSYQVRVKDTLSNTKNICCGVAQVSLLGPLLFNLYINDIPDYTLTKLNMFADDTAVHTTYKRISSVTYALNKHLKLLEKYYDQWKISINVEKSAAVIFTKKRKLPPPPTMFNTTIPWSQNTKYLGIIFDKNLTWRTHIQHTRNKFRKIMFKLYPLIGRNSELSRDNKVLLFTAVMRPILVYGCPVWGYAAKTNINILDTLQNSTIRMIPWSNTRAPTQLSVMKADFRMIQDISSTIGSANQLPATR
ncbi:RNA-directed DNA polymerase from mobile element jockey [Trichonephila clavipes]|nr:RNA-directed DNA polymerase from mobile element jockey [Trichonephila clavipes]